LTPTVGYDFTYTDAETGGVVATVAFETAVVPKPGFDRLLADAGLSTWDYCHVRDGPDLVPLSTPSEPVVCIARR
jgi:hypothetical protein